MLMLNHIEFSSLGACGKITEFHHCAGIKTISLDLSNDWWAGAKEPLPAHKHIYTSAAGQEAVLWKVVISVGLGSNWFYGAELPFQPMMGQ